MDQEEIELQGAACPLPLPHNDQIVLGHGSGGRLMHDLIARCFLPRLGNSILLQGDDAGSLPLPGPHSPDERGRLAMSTDSHVVTPLFFPGGDIGRLAICGTVNDLAMIGAIPLYITAGFILEEGLDMATLNKVILAMQSAAQEAGVEIVAGDTKVVQKGKADGIYINTAGLGWIPPGIQVSGALARPGDVVLISGSVGNHGIAVLEARGELGFISGVQSDIAPLNHMVRALLEQSCRIHSLRDPTRGGLATTLNEIARQSNVAIQVNEIAIPIDQDVSAACEMLGLDPLYIANEGKLLAIVAPEDAEKALQIMHSFSYGQQAAVIGRVEAAPVKKVLVKTSIGARRILDMLSGEMLPRIC